VTVCRSPTKAVSPNVGDGKPEISNESSLGPATASLSTRMKSSAPQWSYPDPSEKFVVRPVTEFVKYGRMAG
jgi:hypothetical protein